MCSVFEHAYTRQNVILQCFKINNIQLLQNTCYEKFAIDRQNEVGFRIEKRNRTTKLTSLRQHTSSHTITVCVFVIVDVCRTQRATHKCRPKRSCVRLHVILITTFVPFFVVFFVHFTFLLCFFFVGVRCLCASQLNVICQTLNTTHSTK